VVHEQACEGFTLTWEGAVPPEVLLISGHAQLESPTDKMLFSHNGFTTSLTTRETSNVYHQVISSIGNTIGGESARLVTPPNHFYITKNAEDIWVIMFLNLEGEVPTDVFQILAVCDKSIADQEESCRSKELLFGTYVMKASDGKAYKAKVNSPTHCTFEEGAELPVPLSAKLAERARLESDDDVLRVWHDYINPIQLTTAALKSIRGPKQPRDDSVSSLPSTPEESGTSTGAKAEGWPDIAEKAGTDGRPVREYVLAEVSSNSTAAQGKRIVRRLDDYANSTTDAMAEVYIDQTGQAYGTVRDGDGVSLVSLQQHAMVESVGKNSVGPESAPTALDDYLGSCFEQLDFKIWFKGGGVRDWSDPHTVAQEVAVKALLANSLSLDIPALIRLFKLSYELGFDFDVEPALPALQLVRAFEAFRGMLKETLVNNPPPLVQKNISDYLMSAVHSPFHLWGYGTLRIAV